MLIAIFVLQIITLVFGLLPMAMFFIWAIIDDLKKSKEKRAAQIAALAIKKSKQNCALFDKPIALRKEIIKQAAIECGMISNVEDELFDKFWGKYKEIVSEKEVDSFIWD